MEYPLVPDFCGRQIETFVSAIRCRNDGPVKRFVWQKCRIECISRDNRHPFCYPVFQEIPDQPAAGIRILFNGNHACATGGWRNDNQADTGKQDQHGLPGPYLAGYTLSFVGEPGSKETRLQVKIIGKSIFTRGGFCARAKDYLICGCAIIS